MDATTTIENLLEEEVDPNVQDALDDLVHQCYSEMASALNNAGPADQLRFLRDQMTDSQLANLLGLPVWQPLVRTGNGWEQLELFDNIADFETDV